MTVIRSDDVRNHFVYRAFDSQGRLLYVGCTQNLKARWQQHRFNNRHWTVQTHRMKVQGPYCYRKARELEKVAIETEEPRYGWTPERGEKLQRKNRWQENRLQELLAGRRPWDMDFAAFSALHDVAIREAHNRFPMVFNSDNHPTHGVPEGMQPYQPFDDIADEAAS